MARLPALIDTLSTHDARGRPTIEHIARLVREAGFIQTTKRGRGAAEMTEADAAALLIGLNAIEMPTDAARQVSIFRDLTIQKATPIASGPVPAELEPLVQARTFREALETLITAVPFLEQLRRKSTAALLQTLGASLVDLDISANEGFALAVSFYLPGPSARILVRWTDTRNGSNGFQQQFGPKEMKKQKWSQDRSDRSVVVTFGINTLMDVHKTLWPDS